MSTTTPLSNSQLIASLGLIKHPEGGYFVETDRQPDEVPTPFVDGKPPRSLATSIYYLLTHDDPNGVIHMNKSVTYHVLHHGRAEYTLIHPTSPPRIEKVVMGEDVSKGETRLLLVGTGVWKMSKLLPVDLAMGDKNTTGCLITEVVVPGFHWEDHQFLTMDGLTDLFKDSPNAEQHMDMLAPFVRKY
ncbi:hypothetical protein CYLTODRAFT_434221 [Cylindrobasidium torrendii FP15055 ss-10]|uniref:DUF985 domain-containing protein n=1 Tax=Cylindrobasidium torrendii FP15055 ss-10 TaxID=1314674 RepID=A0A0D7BTJ5_9AGAR|nr:hypothetical protein CYLTODRAFT_434221 [Cylindrobasidium torrendii FP15055 ss-10]